MNELSLKLIEISTQGGKVEDEVKNLLHLKANINFFLDGDTPLIGACRKGHVELAALLIHHDANVNLPKKMGATPLYIASQEGHREVVDLLLQHNANPNLALESDGATALYTASFRGRREVMSLLITHKASLDLPNKNGATPLFVASQEGHTEAVALLITHKATINLPAKDGATPLYFASFNGHKEVVALLITYKANIDLAMKSGWNTLHIAASRGHGSVVGLLLTCNADPSIKVEGKTAQEWAVKQNHLHCATVFDEYKKTPKQFEEKKDELFKQLLEKADRRACEAEERMWEVLHLHRAQLPQRPSQVEEVEEAKRQVKAAESRALAAESHLQQVVTAAELFMQKIQHRMVEKMARTWQAENSIPTFEDIQSITPSLEPAIVGAFLTAGVVLQRQDIVQSILQQFPQLNLDIPTVKGVSPLYYACHNGGDVNIVKLLLHSRADPLKQQPGDGDGEGDLRGTPFQAALRRGHYNVLVAIEPRTELEGVKLKDLHVIKRLGSRKIVAGYYGVCSAVYHVQLKRFPQFEMAMKVIFNLHNDTKSTVGVLAKFETEFKSAMTRPRHNNICTPFHVFVDSANKDVLPSWDLDPSIVNDRCVFLLMEILPQSLLQLIRDQQNQTTNHVSSSSSSTSSSSSSSSTSSSSSSNSDSSINIAKKDYFNSFPYIATQLLKGVQFLQQHQVCHRDLKADNILVSSSDGIVKITDFGCCIDFKAERLTDFKLPFQTRYIDRGGAADYLPPEIRNAEHGPNAYLDYSKSDNYALGRILYEMLFDNNPCDQNGVMMMDKVKEAVAARSRTGGEGGGGGGGEKDEKREEELKVVLSLLNPDPQKRASIHEAMEMMKAIMRGPTGDSKDGTFSLWDNLA